MSKVDIISGFLGAGKTTLIQKLIKECFQNKQVVLIENEFGEIGIDGTFLQEAGIQITEMNSGCICCSLVGDFAEALAKVYDEFHPDHILIEPSGVGKLSDVMKAIVDLNNPNLELSSHICVVDGQKNRVYMKNFGEFYNNQIQYASAIFISRSQFMDEDKLQEVVERIKTLNSEAPIVTTPWDQLEGEYILSLMQNKIDDLLEEAIEEARRHQEEHEHEHHHDHDEEEHEHHHDHDEEEHEHHHHHHDHGHHHHHHADEFFDSVGFETVKTYTKEALSAALEQLQKDEAVLRAKGYVKGEDCWYYFDLVPEEYEIRTGKPEYTGKVVVIGHEVNETKVKELFK